MLRKSLIIVILFVFASCSNDKDNDGSELVVDTEKTEEIKDNDGSEPIVNNEKTKIIKDYQDNYLGSEVTNVGWTGNADNCNAGAVPQSVQDKVIQRINYFRRMVGLNDNTTLDASKFKMYQEAALIMKANKDLSHFPPKNWKCWTELGAKGAKTSNLSIGFGINVNSTSALLNQMRDKGDNNIHVGHRRWILYSKAQQFSHGSTNNTMSLGVIGFAKNNTKIPEYIAYPPKGYVPQKLVFNRWSFAISGADFSEATITMKDANGNLSLSVVSKTKKNIGDNTIVWEPKNIVKNSEKDIQYTVTVNGIKNAKKSSYTYNVTIIKP